MPQPKPRIVYGFRLEGISPMAPTSPVPVSPINFPYLRVKYPAFLTINNLDVRRSSLAGHDAIRV